MLFLGLPSRTSGRTEMFPFQTNEQPATYAVDPRGSGGAGSGSSSSGGGSTSTSKGSTVTGDSYQCTGPNLQDYCNASGLYDLQFRQIQDLLNQCQQKLYTDSNGAYEGPSVPVDGVLTMQDAQSLAQLSPYGVFFDVHPTPQWMADNASGVIATLNQFLGRAPQAWNAGIFTSGKTGTRTDVNPTVVVDPGSSSFMCDDGSIVADQSMCPASTTTAPGTTTTPGGIVTTTPPAPIVATPIPISKPMKWGLVIAGVLAGVAAAAFLQHRG